MKKVNEKNDDFLMKICGFWIDFEADFKRMLQTQWKICSEEMWQIHKWSIDGLELKIE